MTTPPTAPDLAALDWREVDPATIDGVLLRVALAKAQGCRAEAYDANKHRPLLPHRRAWRILDTQGRIRAGSSNSESEAWEWSAPCLDAEYAVRLLADVARKGLHLFTDTTTRGNKADKTLSQEWHFEIWARVPAEWHVHAECLFGDDPEAAYILCVGRVYLAARQAEERAGEGTGI